VLAVLALPAMRAATAPVELRWLEGAPAAAPTGVSWGVPWPRGAVPKGQAFALTTATGGVLPLQTWPLAYWPDGSLKWSGFATVAGPDTGGTLRLAAVDAAPEQAGPVLRVRRSETGVEVDTGRLRLRVTQWGSTLVESLAVDGREVARHGRLVCILQQGPSDGAAGAPRRERFLGRVKQAPVEQSGPVRAVLKIEGVHKGCPSWCGCIATRGARPCGSCTR